MHGLFPHVFDRGSRAYAKVLVRHDHGCGAERYRSFFGNGGQHGGSVPDRLHCPRFCHRLRHVGSEKARCENTIRFRACEYALGSGCEHHRKYYADFVHKTKATMRLEHKPGETMQVDWAGQTAHIVDTDTGEQLDVYLFVAVLPYSGYAYTEAFLDMKQDAWITAHVNAYRFFGGVTRILTPDNLKTGVIKNTKDETVVNKSYQEMAEHYGTAIIPARPRKPKDKVFVEGSVGVVSTWILAALRNQQFLSLKELNLAIQEKLTAFNNKPFQKKEGSRAELFQEEQLFLLPLPPTPFELAVWKVATL